MPLVEAVRTQHMEIRVIIIVVAILVIALAAFIFHHYRAEKHVVYNERGLGLIGEGKFKEAVTYLESAVKMRPDYAEAYRNLGVAYGKTGQLKSAKACLRKAVRLEPGNPQAHFNLGRVLEKEGKYANALACFSKAEEIKGEYPRARKARAEVHYQMGKEAVRKGNKGRAEELLHRAVELDQEFAQGYFALGKLYMSQRRYNEAADNFTIVSKLKPGAKVRTSLGEAYQQLGKAEEDNRRYKQAVLYYRRSLALTPRNALSHYRLGISLGESGHYAEAGKELKKAFQLQPDIKPDTTAATSFVRRGKEFLEEGKLESAEKKLKLAAAVAPELQLSKYHAEIRFRMGNEARKRKQWRKALALYRDAEELYPALPGLAPALAELTAEHGEVDEAIERYELLLEKGPGNTSWSFALGDLYYKRGNYEKAVRIFTSLGERGRRKLLDAYIRWAGRDEEQKNWPGAVESYARYLALSPDNSEIRTRLYIALSKAGRHEEAIAGMRELMRSCSPPVYPHVGEKRGKHEESFAKEPPYVKHHYILGLLYRDAGMKDKAMKFSRQHAAWAGAFAKLGMWDDAAREFRRAADIFPECYECYGALGVIHYQEKRFKEALVAFNKAAELKPDDVMFLNNLAVAHARMGNFSLAESLLLRTNYMNPNFIAAYYNLSQLYKRMGKDEDSAFWRRNAIRLENTREFYEDGILIENEKD